MGLSNFEVEMDRQTNSNSTSHKVVTHTVNKSDRWGSFPPLLLLKVREGSGNDDGGCPHPCDHTHQHQHPLGGGEPLFQVGGRGWHHGAGGFAVRTTAFVLVLRGKTFLGVKIFIFRL